MSETPDSSEEATSWTDLVEESTADEVAEKSASADLDDGVAADRAQPSGTETEDIEPSQQAPPAGEEMLAAVREYFETIDSGFAPAPSDSFVAERWFDLSMRDEARAVERYWLTEPYAFASVRYHADSGEYQYHVVEPELTEFEQYVRRDMREDLRDLLLHVDPEDANRGTLLDRELEALSDRYAREADAGSLHKIRYYIRRDILGYDKIDCLLNDQRIEDISCDGADVPVYIYHNEYRDMETNVVFPEQQLNSFVVRMAQRAGRHISVANPMVDASLPTGSRVQLTLGREVSTRGSNFTVRQFSEVPITPVDLINWGTFSVETMTYLWLAIENNLSLVFAGGTASGKTTSMNAISMFIPSQTKVITIEDTREITLPHDNWIQSVTREGFLAEDSGGEIDMYQLLQAALRQRPEYLLVGEIRTEEAVALAFFQAMSTGHTAYTTMHADSTETVLSRLQNPPLNVPKQMVQELDIVAIQQQLFVDGQRVRRNMRLSELSTEEDSIGIRDIYNFDPSTDSFEQQNMSANLRQIMRLRGWDETELAEELQRREQLLRHLVAEDVADYESFTDIIRRYQTDPDEVMQQVRAGQLEP